MKNLTDLMIVPMTINNQHQIFDFLQRVMAAVEKELQTESNKPKAAENALDKICRALTGRDTETAIDMERKSTDNLIRRTNPCKTSPN